MPENKRSGMLGYISTVLAKSVKEEATPGGSRYLVNVPHGMLASVALTRIISPLHSSLNIETNAVPSPSDTSMTLAFTMHHHFDRVQDLDRRLLGLSDDDTGRKCTKGEVTCNFLQETNEIEVLSSLAFSESLKADLAQAFLPSKYITNMQEAVCAAKDLNKNCLQNNMIVKAVKMHPETATMLKMLDMVEERPRENGMLARDKVLNILGHIPWVDDWAEESLAAEITEDESTPVGKIDTIRIRNMLPSDLQYLKHDEETIIEMLLDEEEKEQIRP